MSLIGSDSLPSEGNVFLCAKDRAIQIGKDYHDSGQIRKVLAAARRIFSLLPSLRFSHGCLPDPSPRLASSKNLSPSCSRSLPEPAPGFTIYSSSGTAKVLNENGVPAKSLFKLAEGRRPNILDMIKNGEIALIINTPAGQSPREDEVKIRSTAVANRIPVLTNLRAAEASIQAIRSLQKNDMGVQTLQEYHE